MSGAWRDVADTTRPVLVAPPPASIIPADNLVFTFSEPIKLGSGTLILIANGQQTSFDIAGNPRMTVATAATSCGTTRATTSCSAARAATSCRAAPGPPAGWKAAKATTG